MKGGLWVRLHVHSIFFSFLSFDHNPTNYKYDIKMGLTINAWWKNQPDLMSITYSKRLAVAKIWTQAHQSWDVNRGGYVTRFLDRIPIDILPLVYRITSRFAEGQNIIWYSIQISFFSAHPPCLFGHPNFITFFNLFAFKCWRQTFSQRDERERQ